MIALVMTTAKMSVVLTAGLITASALGRKSAALRHWVITAAILGAGAVPIVSLAGPAWMLPIAASTAPQSDTLIAWTIDGPRSGPAAPLIAASATLAPASVPRRRSSVIVVAWLIGAAVNLLILLAPMARLRTVAAHATIVTSGRWHDALRRTADAAGVRRRVALLQSDRPALLVTWGAKSPKVLLPRGAGDWSGERIQIVLTHEIAHIARADWLLQIGAELLRSVYWFNPLLWIACARLRYESERACDDAVLAAGIEGREYASQLVDLARLFGRSRGPWLPAPAMAGRPSTLERRVVAMLDTRLPRAPLTRAVRYSCLGVFLALSLPLAALAQSQFGSVSGTVVDQMNGALPGVTITLSDAQRGATHEVRTDREGRFQLIGLPSGTYRISTAEMGFQPQSTAVVINGDAIERDLTLAIAPIQETIAVTGGEAGMPARTGGAAAKRSTPRCAEPAPTGASVRAIGGNIRAPRKLNDIRPAYLGVDGIVKLAALIGTDGSVTDVTVVSSDRPELDAPAIAAVSQWLFDATLLNCTPVDTRMNVIMAFRRD
jgi:beta-lactamase regulating signal transducer with metallopeptidase domain